MDLFHCLQRGLQYSRIKNITDHIAYKDSKKDSVMLFISKDAIVIFLSQLSGLDGSDVKEYL